jgi:glyoxylase-like metal-dependent hydrolase (beta-lactamase superfamily II)
MQHVRVTPLEIARLRFDLREPYDLPEGHPAAQVAALPVLAYHLALPGRSVLVDAPSYDPASTPATYLLPAYASPPPLVDQLRAAGIEPADVTDVIITHAHFDHLGALALDSGPGPAPAFPRARHFLGRAEWDPAAFAAMAREDLMTVERAGLLTLVDVGVPGSPAASGGADRAGMGPAERPPVEQPPTERLPTERAPSDVDLDDGLSLVAAPGESPGHLLARAQLGDDVVYVAGDLYHHALEFREPDLNVVWVDADAMRASKARLAERAAREGARVYFSHIAGAHRVRRDGPALRWEASEGP